MSKTEIEKKSFRLFNINPAKNFLCFCGRSSNQPFCDKTHKGIEPAETKKRGKKQIDTSDDCCNCAAEQ